MAELAETLELRSVSKTVGSDTHLYKTDLTLTRGLNVIIGPTLAGKTTLMRLIAGLDRPTAGRIIVDGLDVTGMPVQQRNVAMVYQQFINYPSLTTYDNIASPLKIAGLNRRDVDKRVREVAELLHIEAYLQRYPNELSGGQQQRTAIARALVKDAKILLFDEPLVNLDYKLREELRREMRAIFAERNILVIYATTEPMEVLLLGGRAVVMDKGKVLQVGPCLDVFRNPTSIRAAEVFSDPKINSVKGRVDNGKLTIGSGVTLDMPQHLRCCGNGDYVFAVRANHLTITSDASDQVALPATVDLAEVSGSETFIHVNNSDFDWVVQEEGVFDHRLGDQIAIYLNPNRLFAFAMDGGLVQAPR